LLPGLSVGASVTSIFAGYLVIQGAARSICADISLLFLPPYSPELNPKENIWDEIREKIFKNYTFKSMDSVHEKLNEAILYIESNPKMVKSITLFPYIVGSL
jgi:hypothetical protein